MVTHKIFSAADQGKNDREAREADRRCGQAQGANPGIAGALLRPLLLRGTAAEMVRANRACAERTNCHAHAETCKEIRDGARGSGLRSRNVWRVLQYCRRLRCRWKIPRKISQAPYSPLPSRLLGKVLFHAGEC